MDVEERVASELEWYQNRVHKAKISAPDDPDAAQVSVVLAGILTELIHIRVLLEAAAESEE